MEGGRWIVEGDDSVSNRLTSLQLDAVVENAILAAAACELQGNGVLTRLQPRIEEVGGEKIVTPAVHGAAIDGGVVDARLPGGTLCAVNLYVNRRATAGTASNGGSKVDTASRTLSEVELDSPRTILRLNIVPVGLLVTFANGVGKVLGHQLPQTILTCGVAQVELAAAAIVLTYHPL